MTKYLWLTTFFWSSIFCNEGATPRFSDATLVPVGRDLTINWCVYTPQEITKYAYSQYDSEGKLVSCAAPRERTTSQNLRIFLGHNAHSICLFLFGNRLISIGDGSASIGIELRCGSEPNVSMTLNRTSDGVGKRLSASVATVSVGSTVRILDDVEQNEKWHKAFPRKKCAVQ